MTSAEETLVVGIGASAGTVHATQRLLSRLAGGPAIVVVQDFAPGPPRALAKALAQVTKIPVRIIRDRQRLIPDNIFVAPPDCMIRLEGERLRLDRMVHQAGPPRPIDRFFASLAQARGPAGVGVLLSGSGSDGTHGLREIREQGGMTFAQDPTTTTQPGRTQAAIDAGVVDFALGPEEIADQLIRLHRCRPAGRAPAREASNAATQDLEPSAFFHDRELFERIQSELLPRMLDLRQADAPIRIWVANCGSGEETYSLAIAMLEALAARSMKYPVQIFATDADARLLEKARRARVPRSIEGMISEERLARSFTFEDGHYRVASRVRDLVLFARHDIAVDPPFSRVDLLSCRNLLARLDRPSQRRILSCLHYALQPRGVLILGRSEDVEDAADLFRPLDRALKIFYRCEPAPLAHDLKRAHEEERRIRARLEAQVRANAIISEAHAGMSEHGLESVLECVADQARALVGAGVAALGIGGSPDEAFEFWAESGVTAETWAKIGRAPRRVGVLERVAAGSIIRIADVSRHESFQGFPPGHFALGSFLGVPLLYRERSVGSLYVANKQTAAAFDEEDEHALLRLAESAAVVVESALATDARNRERTRLRSILDQLPEAVIVKDARTRLVPNARALELSVDSEGRVDPFGNPIQWNFRWPDGRPVEWSELPLVRAYLGREAVANVEMMVVTRDGRAIPILVDAAPLLDPQGKSLGAVAVWRDIEQLKHLEQLRREWSAVVAHDLRQPLAIIRMWDQQLARSTEPRDQETARAVSAIDRAVSRMSGMLDDLIDSSTIETHRVALQRTRFSLDELIREACELPEAGRIRLGLEQDLEVEADRGRIARVFDNLLSNALKYGDADGEIAVAAARRNGLIEVTVTNRGPTLAADEIAQLFSRFYRTRGARRKEGLGLGLYIARGFIEAHGGKLWCESEKRTTTFHFELPAAPAVESHPEPQPHA